MVALLAEAEKQNKIKQNARLIDKGRTEISWQWALLLFIYSGGCLCTLPPFHVP